MSKLTWDVAGERFYETGVKNAVLYVYDTEAGKYGDGVAWNGITAITESPSGAEATPLYADDIKYLNLLSTEEFGASIEAYTYPDEFAECDGSAAITSGFVLGQQKRKTFGLSYITTVGNDEAGNDYGKKLHIIYGCLAAPSEKAYASINDSPEAITFSWEITTTPVNVGTIGGVEYKPTASITIEEQKIGADAWGKIVDELHGSTDKEANLPLPSALYEIAGVGNA